MSQPSCLSEQKSLWSYGRDAGRFPTTHSRRGKTRRITQSHLRNVQASRTAGPSHGAVPRALSIPRARGRTRPLLDPRGRTRWGSTPRGRTRPLLDRGTMVSYIFPLDHPARSRALFINFPALDPNYAMHFDGPHIQVRGASGPDQVLSHTICGIASPVKLNQR